jgi:hypothetical protein
LPKRFAWLVLLAAVGLIVVGLSYQLRRGDENRDQQGTSTSMNMSMSMLTLIIIRSPWEHCFC